MQIPGMIKISAKWSKSCIKNVPTFLSLPFCGDLFKRFFSSRKDAKIAEDKICIMIKYSWRSLRLGE